MKTQNIFLIAVGLSASLLSYNVWAVCNANIEVSKPDSIYIDHLDGTVSDSETGLMWQKCTWGQTWGTGGDANSGSDDSCGGAAVAGTWQVALAKANENTQYGHEDWRLPNKNELKSLVEIACDTPAINESLFPSTIEARYWSSTPYYTSNSAGAWTASFNDGFTNQYDKNLPFYVRLVRDSD